MKLLSTILLFTAVMFVGCREANAQSWDAYDSILTNVVKVGDIMTRPADDGSYLIIHKDSTFEVHGNLQTVLKDLWERQGFAWERFGKMAALHEALREVVKNIPDLYSGDGKKYNIAQKRYINLLRNYNKK